MSFYESPGRLLYMFTENQRRWETYLNVRKLTTKFSKVIFNFEDTFVAFE